MKTLKINRFAVLALSAALFAGGAAAVNNNVSANATISQSAKSYVPSPTAGYWNKYQKVVVTKNTPVYKYTEAIPASNSTSKKVGTLKKGTKVYVSTKMRKNADASFAWIVKNNQYKTTNKKNSKNVIYNVTDSSNKWFKLPKAF
ncbi:hypothetical protein GSH19_05540 [Lactobacillus sp. S2-2]|uniref:hypothetical protein n=1 Tax=Lactobacillus sp. S2-2 TaxID=2692917 RepID=UPI001F353960|nr:hypothetical protein [Lactobacillus sp. S2-2]MCF6515614.1 hypothetical protein [Lactobacillus sp. S2-2]